MNPQDENLQTPFPWRLGKLAAGCRSLCGCALILLSSAASAQTGTGLTGKYYDDTTFTTVVTTRTDTGVNFNFTTSIPSGTAITAADTYSIAWSGQIEPAYSELYTFFVTADDGARLWVNDELIVQRTFSQGTGEMRGQMRLKAGHRVNVRLEYIQQTGNASVKLEWASASQTRQVVPTLRLYPTTEIPNGGAVMREVWHGLAGASISTMTSNANYPNKPASREFLTSFECLAQSWEDSFGTRVTGFIRPLVSGNYSFAVSGDEVVQLYLSTDASPANRTLIASTTTATAFRDFSANPSQQSAPRALVAGQRYYVELLHKEDTGADHWSVAWMPPGETAFSIIPGTVLMMPGTDLATPSTSNYFNTLATEQPRLGATRERFAWLKAAYLSPTASAAKTRAQWVVSTANSDVANNTRHYGNEIPRMALAWWLTGDSVYAEKVWSNISETMANGDFGVKWKGFTLRQLAFAYDWLYPYWDSTRRATLLNFLVTKGLNSQANTYGNNIGILNDSGFIQTALAVGTGNEGAAEPDLSQAVNQLVQKINQWEPNNGAWHEGTDYGTLAKLGLGDGMLSMETALGSTFGVSRIPGFFTARREPLSIASNTRQRFTFSDIGTGSNNMMGWANWWARRFDAPETYDFSRQVGNSTWNALLVPETTISPAQGQIHPDQCFIGPADSSYKGFQYVATMRHNWSDPKATFVGGMGGTYMSHGMLQSGTFQLSARGVKWFVDLSSESYSVPSHNITTPRSGADRWDYYRNRAEGHNCLIVNPTSQPDRIWNAPSAPMIAYQSTQNGERSFAVWDLTNNITGVTKVQRGIQLLGQRKQVLVQDEIVNPTPTTCWWFAHCSASVVTEISADGSSITLKSGTERLWGKIVGGGGVWTVRSALPLPTSPAPAENADNSGYKKLSIQLTNVTNTTLAVWFVPLAPGETAPTTTPAITALNTWNLAAQNESPIVRNSGADSVGGAPVDVDLRALASDDWTPVSQMTFAAGNAVGGTVVMQPDGFTARFTPTPAFPSAQNFTFTATDTDGATSLAATITIGASPVITNWTATAGGNWSTASNWESSQAAVSGRGSEVRVLNGVTLAPGAAFTITNDRPGTTQMNVLSLRGSHASGSATVTTTGNPFQLVTNGATLPRMELSGPTSGFTHTVSNNIELAADTTFNGGNTGRVNFNGVISGAGGFTRTGSYTTLFFGNNNSYQGPTIISSGSLTVGLSSSSTVGSLGLGDVTTSGTLTFQRGNAYDVTNAISGTGGIVQNGTGTLTLNPENSYTGSTQIYSGVLVAASLNSVNGGEPALPESSLGAPTTVSTGTIGLASSSSATLRYVGTGETTDRVVNLRSTAGGTIEHAGTGLLKFSSNFTATGASTKTLTLSGSTAGVGELAGAVVDNSTTNKTNLAKSGTGTWVLGGVHSYTGTTTVGGGSLVVNGSIASPAALTISSGARLAGGGSIASPVTVTGTIAPGDPFGTMTTASTMSFGSASRLTWEAGGNSLTSADRLSTGALSITTGAKIDLALNSAGSTVNFLHSFWRTARSFPIVTATSVTGSFSIGTISADAGGRAAATYGSFSLQHTTTGVNLLWTPIPGFPVIDDPVISLVSPTESVVSVMDAALSLRLAVDLTGGIGTSVVWTQVSGPGTVVFENAAAADTRAAFSAAGSYTLRCTATNAVGSGSMDITVLVEQTASISLRDGEENYGHQATFVRGDTTTWNSGARDQILLGRTNAAFRSLISFDIPPLEPGETVEGVSLDFWVAQIGSGSGALGTVELRKLNRAFDEGTGDGITASNGTGTGADWATRTGDPADPWTTAGLGSGTDYDPGVLASVSGIVPTALAVGSQVTFSSTGSAIRSVVTNAAGASEPLGLMLKTNTDTTLSNHFIRLASDDHATLEWRPQLTVLTSMRPAPVLNPGTAPAALVGTAAALNGSVSNATAAAWSLVSGPGSVSFAAATSPVTTVMFSKPGTYTLRLSAANGFGETSQTLSVTTAGTALTNREFWRQTHFGTTANTGDAADDADPNHDGEENFLEFATGQDPSASTLVVSSLTKDATGLEFTYARSKSAVQDGITYSVEYSDLLTPPWTTVGPGTVIADDGRLETVRVTIPAGPSGSRFLHLKVSKP